MPNTGKSITITNVPFSPKRIDGYAYYSRTPSSPYTIAVSINLYGFNQIIYFISSMTADDYIYNMYSNTFDKYIGASIKKNSSNKYDVTLTISNDVNSEYNFYADSSWRFWFSNSTDWTHGN